MSAAPPLCQHVVPLDDGRAADVVTLTYDARLLRRKRLISDNGTAFLVDLPHARSVDPGDAFLLADGQRIAVAAAAERLIEVTGDLPRLSWHIGNRHAPCQIGDGHLLILHDPVMAKMLEMLGAHLRERHAPFRPEGGAYGHGRTMSHSHGPDHSHS